MTEVNIGERYGDYCRRLGVEVVGEHDRDRRAAMTWDGARWVDGSRLGSLTSPEVATDVYWGDVPAETLRCSRRSIAMRDIEIRRVLTARLRAREEEQRGTMADRAEFTAALATELRADLEAVFGPGWEVES